MPSVDVGFAQLRCEAAVGIDLGPEQVRHNGTLQRTRLPGIPQIERCGS